MAKRPFTRDQFLHAGLSLLEENGFQDLDTQRHRAAIYIHGVTPEGEPFAARFRSTMDRGLLATAGSNDADASPKIEGEGLTHLLLVTTKRLREKSPLEGYLIPMGEAVSALKENHRRWLATNPKHSNPDGSVTRWIALKADRLTSAEFAERLAKHKLQGEVLEDSPVLLSRSEEPPKSYASQLGISTGSPLPTKDDLASAPLPVLRDAFKRAVAREHGVDPEQVNLKIEILA